MGIGSSYHGVGVLGLVDRTSNNVRVSNEVAGWRQGETWWEIGLEKERILLAERILELVGVCKGKVARNRALGRVNATRGRLDV